MPGGSRTRGRTTADVVVAIKRLELGNDVSVFDNAGVPVDGVSGPGAGFAGKGALCIDRTNGDLYQNKTGTKASPVWIAR